MKNPIYTFLIVCCLAAAIFGLSSCKDSEDDTTVEPDLTTDTTDTDTDTDTTQMTLISQGEFIGAGNYTAEGTVKIYEGTSNNLLVLENFKGSGGPDLQVYLSQDLAATTFLNLGTLQGTQGTFTYTFPSGTNISTLNNCLIWCRQFSVLFGSAPLTK